MHFLFRLVGWLCLIGLLGLVFTSTRNREIAAIRNSTPILSDSRQLFAYPGIQALARQEQPDVHLPGANASGSVVAEAAARLPGEVSGRLTPAGVAGEKTLLAGTAQEKQPARAQPSSPRTGQASQSLRVNLPAQQVQRLSIPALRVDVQVVQVPFDQVTWDFAGIQQEVAQLGSLPGEQTSRNLTLAGHVTVYNGSHGPFRYLHWLKPGDILIAETARAIRTYQVREQIVVRPDDVSVTANTSEQQLTLITCTEWSEALKIYQRRRVVLADLVSIEPRQEIRQ